MIKKCSFDSYIKGIRDNNHLHYIEFELMERSNGHVIPAKYQDGYVIVDNGYLNRSVKPFKVMNFMAKIVWSKWVESMRKMSDVHVGLLEDIGIF